MPLSTLRRVAASLVALFLTAALAGCASSAAAPDGKLNVVATTSTLASLALGALGSHANVSTLVPVGASPEDYQPTPRDVQRIHDADVLVENGGGLESWLAGTIANARNAHLVVVVCTDGLPLRGGNPHLWMDPVFARAYVEKIRDAVVRRDPANAAAYESGAKSYDAQLRALQARIAKMLAVIPSAQRKMVVFHDAWSYYNQRFGLETVGVIESSPGREPSPASLAQIVSAARANHVRAIFAEPEYSPKLVQSVARSAGISTVAVLYDDSVGTDPRFTTYVSMLEYDTQTIVRALR